METHLGPRLAGHAGSHGAERGMAGVLPPPRAPGVQGTHVNINLDGYRLGEAVACHVARTNQHVAAAAQFDAGAMHMPVNLQTA
jgi:hypothetical protein